MNPDRPFDDDEKSVERTGAWHPSSGSSATGSSATDLIGTIASTPDAESSHPPTSRATESMVGRTPPAAQTPLPVVHEVVFKSSTSSPDRIDPLLQMLRGMPSVVKPAEAAAAPAKFAETVRPVETSTSAKVDVSAALPSGGFTQLLRALNVDSAKEDLGKREQERYEAAKSEAKRPEASKVSEPVRSAEEVAPAAPAVKPFPVSSITQLLRTIDSTAAPVAAPLANLVAPVISPAEKPIAARQEPVQPQVTSFRHGAAAAAPLPVVATTPAEKAISFTQLFESVDTPKDSPAKSAATTGHTGFTQMFEALGATKSEPARIAESPAASARVPQDESAAAPPASPIASTYVQPAAPGSFTQMFRSLEADSDEGSKVDVPSILAADASAATAGEPAMVDASTTGSFTRIFRTLQAVPVDTAKVEAVPGHAAAPAASPGSFTQMFRSLDAKPAEMPVEAAPVKIDAAPVVSSQKPAETAASAPPASQPGSFTQMFRSLDAAPVEADPVAPAMAANPAVPVAPPASQPGSFTQMFQSLGSAQEEARAAIPLTVRGNEGSFTELFRTPSDQGSPAAVNSFGQAYIGVGASGASSPLPSAADSGYTLSAQPSQAPLAAKGGLTQLLRTLNEPGARPHAAPAEDLRPLGQEQSGTFTSVYGRLDGKEPPAAAAGEPYASPGPNRDATQTFRPSVAPSTSSAPPISAGPSEFTRILNASTLRESGLRGGGEAAAVAAGPSAAPPAVGASGFPSMAAPSVPGMAMPHMGGGGAAAAPAAPHWAAPALPHAPAVPHAPQVSQVKTPEIPKAAAPAGNTQQFLPLLLILIIFLLLAILVAVIFFMKR